MKRLMFFLMATMPCWAFAQELTFTISGGKPGKIKVSAQKIENNNFSLIVKAQWLNSSMLPINDKGSCVVFDKSEVKLPNFLMCKTFESATSNIFFFNDSLKLDFVVYEEMKNLVRDFEIDFKFHMTLNPQTVHEKSNWIPFMAKSPRNFVAKIVLSPKDIVDLTPPKVKVKSPEGVMDGFRPIVYSNELEVKAVIAERNTLKSVLINGLPAIPLNDSTYICKVKFTHIGGVYPVRIVATDDSGNVGEHEFFVETKRPDNMNVQPLVEKKIEMISDVDTLIPKIGVVYENRYALIIGNEDYKSHQRGLNYEANVEFARHDATIFRQYAINTLGIKEQNILFLIDAKAVEMHRAINQINSLLKASRGEGEVVVFYAGHGFPDEKTREAFIVPVDVSGTDLEFAIKLKDFYSKLSEHPNKGITVFLDACFSGGGREQGLLAARAVRVRPREEAVKGKMLVFSASAGNESALPYRPKFHGMFTYYLLKALQDREGKISMGEMVDYVTSKVATGSIIHNGKEQNPALNVSFQMTDEWRNWSLNNKE